MKRHSQSIGEIGESLACRYLESKGYVIIERNFQNTKGYKRGEIDIIAQHNKQIVFVEVKTRVVSEDVVQSVIPEENISHKKLKSLEKIANIYIKSHLRNDVSYRFDAIAVLYNPNARKAYMRHLEHIFF